MSQATQRRAAKGLLPLNFCTRPIGQPRFRSTSFPLRVHIVCFPVGRMENEEFEGRENSSYKMLPENVLLLT